MRQDAKDDFAEFANMWVRSFIKKPDGTVSLGSVKID